MRDKRIYLDLDGVLVNWTKAAMSLCNINDNEPAVVETLVREYDSIDKLVGWDRLSKVINEAGTDYWVNLEALPWAKELVERCVEAVGKDNLAFLTSPGRFPWAPSGKMMWRDKFYPGVDLVITKQKYLLAAEYAILIDDDSRQTKDFSEWGGQAFLWPNQYILRKEGMDTTWVKLTRALRHQQQIYYKPLHS